MADTFTGTSALSNLVTGAIDQYVRAELRHTPLLRSVADTRPVSVDRPGSSVALYIHGDLAPATSALNELTDPDAVALPNPTPVTLTPYEYGNSTVTSIKAKTTSFAEIDPYQLDAVAYNMRDSLDILVRDIVSAGDNVRYAGTATSSATVAAADTLGSDDIRYTVAKLRAAAAQGKRGDLYWVGIHPDVAHDLRAESGSGGWRDSHVYAAPGVFWPGEIGVYEGAFFVESARMKSGAVGVDPDGSGVGTKRSVYSTIVAGKEALAEGVVVEPSTQVGVIADRFNRFFPLGWYGFLGWTRFREKALWRIESASSITL